MKISFSKIETHLDKTYRLNVSMIQAAVLFLVSNTSSPYFSKEYEYYLEIDHHRVKVNPF